MNEKEAKAILSVRQVCGSPIRAEGYLEAIEKVKGLEEALETIKKREEKKNKKHMTYTEIIADNALSQWEKVK